MRRNQRLAVGMAGSTLLLTVLAAVWSIAQASQAKAGAFDNQGGKVVSCLTHQSAGPSAPYRAGADADTGRVLRMMRYYTVNGNKPFCDGKVANSADAAWAQLYVDLGAKRANVGRVMGGG